MAGCGKSSFAGLITGAFALKELFCSSEVLCLHVILSIAANLKCLIKPCVAGGVVVTIVQRPGC